MKIVSCNRMEKTATVSSLPVLVFTFSSPLAKAIRLGLLGSWCFVILCSSILSLFTEISKNKEVLHVQYVVA